jgi:two-component system invasion response regulator UvrY
MRVLIVDDHPIVVSGVRALFFAADDDVTVLEACDADSGEHMFIAEQPDVCVLDVNLPTVSGFELARRILTRAASARIIIFSMNDDLAFAARAIEIGAKGYVSKSGDPYALVEAIREVGNGGMYLPAGIAQRIAFAGHAVAQSPLSKLTPREVEILRLLSAGKSLSEIAWMVHSSYKTIANTSSIIRQKLGLRSASELMRFAIESRLA